MDNLIRKQTKDYIPPLASELWLEAGNVICNSIDTSSVRDLSLDGLTDISGDWDLEI